MYLNYFWTCILLVFSRYLKLYFLFQSCFLFWGYFFFNWGVIHKRLHCFDETFYNLVRLSFSIVFQEGSFYCFRFTFKVTSYFNCKVMRSKAQAHLRASLWMWTAEGASYLLASCYSEAETLKKLRFLCKNQGLSKVSWLPAHMR